MPTYAEARIFKIAETKINHAAITAMMSHIDNVHENSSAGDWCRENIRPLFKEWPEEENADDHSFLIEVAGRLCYKSFGLGLNENITKIREGNDVYCKNILATHHGSVLEHATVSFALMGVSRVFTHELCRHRAGTAFAQESMRFVRVDSIRFYYPKSFQGLGDVLDNEVEEIVDIQLRQIEQTYKDLANTLLSNPELPFSEKKKITSAMRRILPDGILTDIILTANHRSWRHMIEVRTAPPAEEEIRYVFANIAQILAEDHPNLYQDMSQGEDSMHCVFANSKI